MFLSACGWSGCLESFLLQSLVASSFLCCFRVASSFSPVSKELLYNTSRRESPFPPRRQREIRLREVHTFAELCCYSSSASLRSALQSIFFTSSGGFSSVLSGEKKVCSSSCEIRMLLCKVFNKWFFKISLGSRENYFLQLLLFLCTCGFISFEMKDASSALCQSWCQKVFK